jgi:outer membrane lipoprotein-sorting protein
MDAGYPQKKKYFFFGSLVILVAFGVGCVHYEAPQPSYLDPLVASARLRSQAAAIDQLAIDAQVDVNKFGITWASVNAVVLARRPGDLRLEILSPTDELVAILTLDQDGFVVYERGADICHVGPQCAMEDVRLLPLPIAIESIVDVLLGGAGLSGEVEFGPMEWDEDSGEYQVRVSMGNDVRRVRLDPCSYALRSTRWESKEGPIAHVHGWQDATGASVPTRLVLDVPSEGVSLDITYRVVDRQMELDAPAFRFICPVGTTVDTHRCAEGGDG